MADPREPSIWDLLASQQAPSQLAMAPSATAVPRSMAGYQAADMGQMNAMAMLASLPEDERIRLMRSWGMVPAPHNGRIVITPAMSAALSPQPVYGDPMKMGRQPDPVGQQMQDVLNRYQDMITAGR